MTSKKKTGFPEYITTTFYVALFSLPFLFLGGSNIADGFRCTFLTFPTNYLFYISPAILYLFLKKTDISQNDRIFYLIATDSILVVVMFKALQTNRSDIFLTFFAMIILCVICININNAFSNLILLSGLLVLKNPVSYLFAVYIPILLLIMIYTFADNRTEIKKSKFLFFTYIYIPVLIAILFFAKKISFNIHSAYINFNNTKSLIELFSGMLLLLIGCVVFIIRFLPVIKNGKLTEKISLILFAVYPLAIAVLNCFFMLVSSEMSHAILLSLLIYITGNIQLSVTCKTGISPLLPQKLRNTVSLIAVILIFCAFSFK